MQDVKTERAKYGIINSEYQMHFIFGLAFEDVAGDMVRFQSCGMPAELPSDYNVTLLQGSQANLLPVNVNSHKHSFTIGDDIELLSDQLNSSNAMFYHRSHSSSLFQNFDESFYSITCKRKSYNFQTELELMQTKYINKHSFLFVKVLHIFTLCLYKFFNKNENTEVESLVLVFGTIFGNWLFRMVHIPVFFWRIETILEIVIQFKLKSYGLRSYHAVSLFFVITLKIILVLYPLYLYFKVWYLLNFCCQFLVVQTIPEDYSL